MCSYRVTSLSGNTRTWSAIFCQCMSSYIVENYLLLRLSVAHDPQDSHWETEFNIAWLVCVFVEGGWEGEEGGEGRERREGEIDICNIILMTIEIEGL